MNSSRHSRFIVVAFLTLIAVGAIAGCAQPTDFSAISKYASTMSQSAQEFSTLAADFGASCERTARVIRGVLVTSVSAQQTTTLITNSPQPLDVFSIQNATPQPGYVFVASTPVSSASPSVSQPSTPQKVLDCDAAKKVSSSWDQANQIILGYVQALGNLADVATTPSVNPSPLVAGLGSAGVSSAATQAISGLATSIFSYFQQRASARAINSFLNDVNPQIPGTIESLESVDAAYTIMLENEFSKTVSEYNRYARIEYNARRQVAQDFRMKTTASAEAMAVIAKQENLSAADKQEALSAMARQKAMSAIAERNAISAIDRHLIRTKSAVETALASINDKLRASADYGTAMATVLRTHEELYNASQSKASFADYVKIVQTTGEPIITNLIDLAKAVK